MRSRRTSAAVIESVSFHPEEREVRYGWVYRDGRYTEQIAELEESDVPDEEE